MNFSGKEGHPNIQPSTRPGIEPGTSGLGGRDLNHCANPSAKEIQTEKKQQQEGGFLAPLLAFIGIPLSMKALTGKGHGRGLHVEPRLPSNTRNIYVPKTGSGARGKAKKRKKEKKTDKRQCASSWKEQSIQ